jgi:hypothetical protein
MTSCEECESEAEQEKAAEVRGHPHLGAAEVLHKLAHALLRDQHRLGRRNTAAAGETVVEAAATRDVVSSGAVAASRDTLTSQSPSSSPCPRESD